MMIYTKIIIGFKKYSNKNDKVKKSDILINLFESYNNKGITQSHIALEYVKYVNLTRKTKFRRQYICKY